MATPRTTSACIERVPDRPAALEPRLRRTDAATAPATRCLWLPGAERTSNAAVRGFARRAAYLGVDAIPGRSGFLQKPEGGTLASTCVERLRRHVRPTSFTIGSR